jgi:uncharacterized repeat protein (TIGR03803 family)
MKRILLLTLLGLIFYTQNAAAQGQLWGTIAQGGEYDLGAIIKLNADGSGFSVEQSVPIEANNLGYEPNGRLIQAQNGKIYGMTRAGGARNKGVLFELDPLTGVFTKKFDFSNSLGSNPLTGLTEANGKLYGAVINGEVNKGDGPYKSVIFEFDPSTGIVVKKIEIDGYGIAGEMIFAKGKLYGIRKGYSHAIFEIELNTFSFTILGEIGYTDLPLTLAKNGKFYGQTSFGGANNYGVLFEFDPDSKIITTKVDFSNETGTYPAGLTLANDGRLYSLFKGGGANGYGILAEYNPENSTFVKKIDFQTSSQGGNRLPSAFTQAADGNLYWLDGFGGSQGDGSINQYNINTNQWQIKYSLVNYYRDGDGSFPYYTALLQTNDGSLFGTTIYGGSNEGGVIFKYDLGSSTYTKKYNFSKPINGLGLGMLVASSSTKKLYGLTDNGGAIDRGVLYEYDPISKVYIKKIDLEDSPSFGGKLIEGPNGKLYWISSGTAVYGAIFGYDPLTNVVIREYDFQGDGLGKYPVGSLFLASNNKLYGFTTNGGSNDGGILFEYDPVTRVFAKKIDLPDPRQIGRPQGQLSQASSGKIYGSTYPQYGSKSVVFEYDLLANQFSIKVELPNPIMSVVAAENKLVLVTGSSYSNNTWAEGALYDYELATGLLTKNLDFERSKTGSDALGLTLSSNGKVYGCLQSGGSNGGGVIYQFDPSNRNFNKIVDFNWRVGGVPRPLTFVPTNLTPPEPQTIAFGTIPTKTYFDPPFNLATTSSAGLPITYTSSNPSVAEITGNQITIMGVGSTTITATQPGNGYYSAATPVQQTLTVNKATQTITFNAIADKVPSTTTFNLDAVSTSGLAITYASSNLTVATVTGNVVTVLAEGSTTITHTTR